MNTTAEGREGVETALEGFCDSLPSGVYEESSHVKVCSLNSVLGSFLMKRSLLLSFNVEMETH